MREAFFKGFFKCSGLSSATDGYARKREQTFPLPQVKRQKLLEPIVPQQAPGTVFESGEDNSSEEDKGVQIQGSVVDSSEKLTVAELNHVDISSSSQGEEKFCLYPSVVYEGDIATVKLGVGQMVILDGCAMVQVVEGQAAMLGYSFPRGTDILVCSSSEPTEVIIIEARHALRDIGRRGGASNHETEVDDATMIEGSEVSLQATLGCQLRFASHSLGQHFLASGAGSERGLSFGLEFVGSLGSSLGKKTGRQFLEQQNQDRDCPDSNVPCSDDDQLNLDLGAGYLDIEDVDESDIDQLEVPVEGVELAATKDSVRKRKISCGQNTDSVKRQRGVEMFDSCSSTRSVPHVWKEAVETIAIGSGVPVVAVAVQRMLESLRLLGS
ncbi:hypothetical protein KC19_4G254100 [Ceratodon purpureus]|uniref:Uncharacterized protein n=1 Tax=Ceratodon purpureus TaxID=3225 RepID=A0A8T0IEM1_CERPU|nr:hypothetical protein KC19_4G254100 [Ceratodon purpureus]